MAPSGADPAADLAAEMSAVRADLQAALSSLATAHADLAAANDELIRQQSVTDDLLTEVQRAGQGGSFSYNVADGTFTYSAQILRAWGLSEQADAERLAEQMIHDDDRADVAATWLRVLTEGGHAQYDHRIVRPDGEIRHLRTDIELGPSLPGVPLVMHGTQMDVTELVTAEQSAKQANAFFDAVLTATPDPTFVVDVASGSILYRSRTRDTLGLSSEQFEHITPDERRALIHPDDLAKLIAVRAEATGLADGEFVQQRSRGRHTDGEWRWMSSRVTPFRRGADGTVIELLEIVRDITEAVRAEELLAHGALHDDLTGLPNRSLLVDRLDAALARAGRSGQEIAVLFCDLDSFKRVNDTGGHAAGDAVLIEIAQRLTNAVRQGDTVARVGGDEFVIIVEPWNRTIRDEQPGIGRRNDLSDRFLAVRIAEAVIETVHQPITVNGVSHVVTASIGITYTRVRAKTDVDGTSADQMLQDADAAMYRAKSRGKNRYALFEPELRTNKADRGRVEQVLRRALHQHGWPAPAAPPAVDAGAETLTAAYQPIFDSDTGALAGFEALARLTDTAGLSISPDVFIGVAEDTGIIHALGAIMLDLACGQLQAWRQQTPGLEHVSMSVNVSALQAQDAALGDDVRGALRAHHLVPSDLVLELTETALLEATLSTIAILRALHSEGIGIAIDDFGTGYASLRYLATLPVTSIKIDRSFTSGLPHDETSRKIVKAVAGLAADLDLSCVVEGVETSEQRAALPDGVRLQGWLTGRPAAPDALDLPALVANGAPGRDPESRVRRG